MQLSTTVEYALRAVVWIADRPQQAWTSADIHEGTMVPSSYLSKVLRDLAAKGIVSSQRGAGGGFRLAQDPEDLTLLDVVNAVEPVQRIRECPLGLLGHGAQLCNLHRRLDEVMAAAEASFAACSIAEMLSRPQRGRVLCPRAGGSGADESVPALPGRLRVLPA